MNPRLPAAAFAAALLFAAPALATPEEDRRTVAALDVSYQAAVKRSDAETMGRILADDMVLILGTGRVISREELLAGARSGQLIYTQQDEVPGSQAVRLWGDTAVVTALLWLRGTNNGVPFDRRLWFSDTYVRTPTGWRYALGQASLPLPQEPPQQPAPPAH